MSNERQLQGWEALVGRDGSLEEIIEQAFDYRGNVTIVKLDGGTVAGYLFNRNGDVEQPFVQLFNEAGEGPFSMPYAEIAGVRFTGRDTAAGKSYEAWQQRRAAERAAGQRPQIFPDDGE